MQVSSWFPVLFPLLLAGLYAPAQEYARKAVVEPVPSTGFYQISVTPELTSAAKADLSDLRIVDDKQRQVPYLLRPALVPLSQSTFAEYPVLGIKTDTARTVVELAVQGSGGTNRVSLVMGNTAVERYTSLSGSNDGRQWFIIDDRILLRSTGADGTGSFVQTVHFPLSRYSFLKLVIYNGATDPLNILKAGVYTGVDGQEPVQWITNPRLSWQQKDSSDRHSYVLIRQNAPYLVDKVMLQVSGPKFYSRRVRLYEMSQKGTRKLLADELISSAEESSLAVNSIKAASLMLQIENGDNPPLALTDVLTQQVAKYMVVLLEKGKSYHLLAGNPDAARPQYDLVQFRDSIPAHLTTLAFGALEHAVTDVRTTPWLEKNFWLWPAIVVMIIAMGLLTYKLLADMKKEER